MFPPYSTSPPVTVSEILIFMFLRVDLDALSFSRTFLLKMPSLLPTSSNFPLHCMISNKDKCAGISLTLNKQAKPPAKQHHSLTSAPFLFLKIIYLFRLCWVLVAARGIFFCFSWRQAVFLVAACELLVAAYMWEFPDYGWNPGPLHWERGVLPAGPPGRS